MAAKNQYQAFLRAKITGAIEEARAASTLTHQGVKGTVLEILISKLFRPLLPSDIGLGTGQIIEQQSGQTSKQIDIILYDKSILPPILFDDTTGIFPIESVLYAIEVKTMLDKNGLSQAHESAKLITSFPHLKGIDHNGHNNTHVDSVRNVVFALNSNLKGARYSDADRYSKICKETNDPAFLRAICVADKWYYYDNGENWVSPETVDKHDEILSFIGGISNTYKSISLNRNYPLLGHYIIPEWSEVITGPETNFDKNEEATNINSIPIKCEKCGLTGTLEPKIEMLGTMTVNSKLSHSCPSCSGTMTSKAGSFIFKSGRLVEYLFSEEH
ncbi:DUF6602 domain-containing protein [Kordiimonas sp. SCSIO 12610]|uniref:DUF6602 domain-containing protein n=1 Tax=Kordiimonas sp. SCSIO 12610 TaxID=2829597 RepID=UPI00210F07DE|nr:DUF6602 domain-containing protein [Kordiimonas sp. SCSIO 12610]UTW54818.1 hypothetical protein KFF44_13540 [Kordiimonas sp. SCSIO 12610]